ncbi:MULTISPECIES: hypothetical protein [unclassified Gordonia (in: high G+C Gram-positive bacteria)]|uniref:hypothetical protein n=1 Tax=unclassified Gordonia (in: high G+C Gram-positive bacteria) TaxID=2657482 RepID=UPI001F0DEDBC|nr:hypothetical protein [Gordonia sp. ABSL49_1]MCH5643957.1 hypothetical protein [Gordonia sp. ABSL49_1]
MDIVESIVKVLVVGLIFGAGLPALFAIGLRIQAAGTADASADGTVSHGNPALRAVGYAIFALVAAVIIIALLWITRQTIYYYFDIQIFPSQFYK